jgi:acetolactate synthase I/II/III large subunit
MMATAAKKKSEIAKLGKSALASHKDSVAGVEVPFNTRKHNQPAYGSDAVAELLNRYGFDYVFLNPGSSYRGLQDSLVNYNANVRPKCVLGLHEDIVTAMAQGYAAASGKPALCILHNLVGLLHGAMGIYNMYCAGSPVVILGGSGPSDITLRGGIDYLHSANTQGEAVRSYVKWDDEATTIEGVLDSIVRGYKIANTAPKGPVYIAIDWGLQEQALNGPITVHDVDQPCFQPSPPPAAPESVVEEVADLLVAAKYPLIIGGRVGYLSAATKPIRTLVEMLGAAYCEDRTFVAMPTLHPQNLTGSREVFEKADVVLCLDCTDVRASVGGYGEMETYKIKNAKRKKVVDLSMNEIASRRWHRIGGAIPDTAVQMTSDTLIGIAQIASAVQKRIDADPLLADRFKKRCEQLAKEKAALSKAQHTRLRERWDENPISPGRMVAELWEAVRGRPWYLTLRNHRSWPEGVWQFDGSGQYAGHSSGGGLGHGPGASVGAAFACRDDGRFPVGIIGDGDFMMAAGAVWTAVHYRTPLLMVINNNTSWYNDEQHQFNIANERGRPPENAYIGTTTRDPDVNLCKVSEGYGASVEGPITDPNDLAAAFRRAVNVVDGGGVAVVDVRTANL